MLNGFDPADRRRAASIPRDRPAHRRALQVRDRRGALRRSIRTCRSACRSGRRRSPPRSRSRSAASEFPVTVPGAVPLRRQPVQRREARRAARRAGLCRHRVARDADRAFAGDAGQRPRLAQGHPRHGDQSRQGRGEGRGRPGAAAGLARDAGRPAGHRSRARTRRSPCASSSTCRPRRCSLPRRKAGRQRIPHPGHGQGRRGTTYAQGYQLVEYPHTTRRHVLVSPQVIAKAVDVAGQADLKVGYVMGVGDEIPAALEQLGVVGDRSSAPRSWRGPICRSTTSS